LNAGLLDKGVSLKVNCDGSLGYDGDYKLNVAYGGRDARRYLIMLAFALASRDEKNEVNAT